jgi:alkylation response protein AidB-like acyl-CoA dehydrogenase
VRPIRNLAGEEHFDEVTFADVRLPAEALLGSEGDGWRQVTEELAFERSGPERYLSSIQALLQLVAAAERRPDDEVLAVAAGRAVAHLATLRQMSIAVAGLLERGANPALEAALVKDLGVGFEQELPGLVQRCLEVEPRPDGGTDLEAVVGYLTQLAPSFSLRGGTREILRGIIARGLGLR